MRGFGGRVLELADRAREVVAVYDLYGPDAVPADVATEIEDLRAALEALEALKTGAGAGAQ